LKLKTESELNIIRGKMVTGDAAQKDLHAFLNYVSFLEALLEEATNENFFGDDGWEGRVEQKRLKNQS